MEISDFLAIGVVGAFVSVLMELIQARYGTGSNASKLLTLVLSIIFGAFYWFLQGTEIWQAILGVLAAASTVYAFVFSGKSPMLKKEDA